MTMGEGGAFSTPGNGGGGSYPNLDTHSTEIHHHVSAEDAGRFSARMLMLAVLCLLVVVLVMAFGLVYATTIAGAAQDSAQRQEQLNDELRSDLECRAQSAIAFDLSKGRLQAAIGEALLLLGRNDDVHFQEALDDIDTNVRALQVAADARESSLRDCSNESEDR